MGGMFDCQPNCKRTLVALVYYEKMDGLEVEEKTRLLRIDSLVTQSHDNTLPFSYARGVDRPMKIENTYKRKDYTMKSLVSVPKNHVCLPLFNMKEYLVFDITIGKIAP